MAVADLVHVHYHWLCARDHVHANPLLEGRLPLSPELDAWLRSNVPFPAQ